jgi:adenylate cyclase
MSQTRRLTAVLAADVVGYSRLIGADEAGTLQAFKTIRSSDSTQWSRRITDDWLRRLAMAFSSSSAALGSVVLRDRVASRDGLEQRRDGRRWYHRARCSAGDGAIFVMA